MKDIIKQILRENLQDINESATKKEVIDFLLDFNFLLSLNLAKVQGQAIDEKAKLVLAQMQQKFKTPVVNGKTFFELADERITPRKDLFNPKFLSAVLTQIRNYLVYIKEHINRFVVDGQYKDGWLNRITKLEAEYKRIIGGSSVSENINMLNEITSDEAWEKVYSDTKRFPELKGNKQIFDKIDALYPKKGNQFNKGYFGFLYNLLKSNELKDEDFYKAKQSLELFDKNLAKLPKEKRNITQFKNLSDLFDAVSGFGRTEDEPQTKTQELKAIKEKEIDRVYEDAQWKVLIPKTERASCLIGKGTQWCTAADRANNMFDSYNNRGNLYVLISKQDDSKYQIHFEDGQLMDSRDRPISATHFFEYVLEDNALVDWFQKEREDFYDFILKTSAEDIAGGGYSELFQEALNYGSEYEISEALNTLRNGDDEYNVADGFLYEKDPYNIKDYQVSNYIQNFNNTEMFPRVMEHLKEIGVDFDDIEDGSVKVLLRGLDDLKKHKLETDKEYKIDKKRKLRILSVNSEKEFPRYKIKINNEDGLVPLDTLLSYLHNRSLFETKKFIKKNLRTVLKLNTELE